MIYEYPEEFVVPVVYANNLNNDSIKYRDWEIDYVQLMPDKKLQENEDFIMDGYEDEILEKGGKKYSGFDMNLLEEPYQENMISYDLVKNGVKSDHAKAILKDIDNEYAKSETLRI